MHLTADTGALTSAVEQAARAVDARGTVRVLSGVLLDATDGLTVTGTDLGVRMVADCDAEVADPGSAVVAAKQLLAALKTLAGSVDVYTDEDRVVVAQGTTVLRFQTFPRGDFPAVPSGDTVATVTVNAWDLLDAWRIVSPAVGRDESRPVLTCARLEAADGRLALVATDSYRLHWATVDAIGDLAALVPGTALGLLARCGKHAETFQADTVDVAGKPWLRFQAECFTLWARQPEGQFPNWRQLWPDQVGMGADVDGHALRAACQRIGKLTRPNRNRPAQLTFGPDGLDITAYEADEFEIREHVAATVTVGGMADPIGVNPAFLLDACQALGATVTIRTINPLRPLTVTNGRADTGCLIMPIRLAG